MIVLSPPRTTDDCSGCGKYPTDERFCDLVAVVTGNGSMILCHDCAHELIEKLLGRYYALWGQALVMADAVASEKEECARIADASHSPDYDRPCAYYGGWDDAAVSIAAAIRARGGDNADR